MFIFLFVLWVILNGRLTVEIAVAGVIICVVLYLFLHKFMGYKMQQDVIIAKAFPRIISYLFYLVIEVIKANLEVAKAILRFDTEPEPVMVKFRTNIKTETGRTVLANSITLTPGTFTIDLEDGEFTVHALDRAYAEGLDQCDFITGINKLEEVLEKEEKAHV